MEDKLCVLTLIEMAIGYKCYGGVILWTSPSYRIAMALNQGQILMFETKSFVHPRVRGGVWVVEWVGGGASNVGSELPWQVPRRGGGLGWGRPGFCQRPSVLGKFKLVRKAEFYFYLPLCGAFNVSHVVKLSILDCHGQFWLCTLSFLWHQYDIIYDCPIHSHYMYSYTYISTR